MLQHEGNHTNGHDCTNTPSQIHDIAMWNTLNSFTHINIYSHGIKQAKVHSIFLSPILLPECVQLSTKQRISGKIPLCKLIYYLSSRGSNLPSLQGRDNGLHYELHFIAAHQLIDLFCVHGVGCKSIRLLKCHENCTTRRCCIYIHCPPRPSRECDQ